MVFLLWGSSLSTHYSWIQSNTEIDVPYFLQQWKMNPLKSICGFFSPKKASQATYAGQRKCKVRQTFFVWYHTIKRFVRNEWLWHIDATFYFQNDLNMAKNKNKKGFSAWWKPIRKIIGSHIMATYLYLQIILWPTALLVTVQMCVFWQPNYKLAFFYIYVRFSKI